MPARTCGPRSETKADCRLCFNPFRPSAKNWRRSFPTRPADSPVSWATAVLLFPAAQAKMTVALRAKAEGDSGDRDQVSKINCPPGLRTTGATGLPSRSGSRPLSRLRRKRQRQSPTASSDTSVARATALLLFPSAQANITRALCARATGDSGDLSQVSKTMCSAGLRTNGAIGLPRLSSSKPFKRVARKWRRHFPTVRPVKPVSLATEALVFPWAHARIVRLLCFRARGTPAPAIRCSNVDCSSALRLTTGKGLPQVIGCDPFRQRRQVRTHGDCGWQQPLESNSKFLSRALLNYGGRMLAVYESGLLAMGPQSPGSVPSVYSPDSGAVEVEHSYACCCGRE